MTPLIGQTVSHYRLVEKLGAFKSFPQFLNVWGKVDPIYKEPEDARVRLARLKGK